MTDVEPSDEQRAAATSGLKNTVIVAPPGCGKTEVLALRAEHLIGMLERDQRILALTFTNRARANLRDRLRQVLGVKRMRRYVTVRNFHGHAAEVLRAHYRTIGLDLAEYKAPTTRALSKALREVTSDRDTYYDAEKLLGEVKRRPLSDEEVVAALAEADGRIGQRAALEVERARQAYNALHYDDLLRHAQRLLRVPGVQRLYRRHYGAVLVDEFQDLSIQQLDIVAKTCDSSRTFAGDPLQGIYTWAGANPVEVERQLERVCPEPIRLTESYRSSSRVLVIVNSIGTDLGAAELRSARPEEWPDSGFGAAVVFSDRGEEAAEIVGATKLLLERDPSLSIGVITRSKWRRDDIDALFATSGLPMRRWDLAVDDPRILQLVRDAMKQLPRGVGFEEARDGVLEVIDPADVDTIEQVEEVFDHLETTGLASPRAALNSLRSSGDPQQAISPGVHLLNAHTGKGQQFDWVFVVGLEERHIPDRRNMVGDLLTEEERVLLVMLSRARHGLVVTSIRTQDGPYGRYQPRRSPWFAPIAAASPCSWDSFGEHVDLAFPVQQSS